MEIPCYNQFAEDNSEIVELSSTIRKNSKLHTKKCHVCKVSQLKLSLLCDTFVTIAKSDIRCHTIVTLVVTFDKGDKKSLLCDKNATNEQEMI